MKATTSFFLHNTKKKDNTRAIYLRVTYQRLRKFYNTGLSLSEDDFKKVIGEKPKKEFKDIALELHAFEAKAVAIIKKMPSFSWANFEKEYLSNRAYAGTISQAFKNYSDKLRSEGRIGTAVVYECAASSFKKFQPEAKFADISIIWLRKYAASMVSEGNSSTTIGIYVRAMRAILNLAIAEGIFNKEHYPFGEKGFQIPTSKNRKKALTLDSIELIYNYKALPGSMRSFAKDLWLFMYIGNGMNMKDLCLLTYQNIKGEFIEFERAKSIRTKKEGQKIYVRLTDDLKAIIIRHGNKDKNDNDYIFPILSKKDTAERQYQLIQQITGVVNDHIKAIAKEVGIEENLTTYFARHSFATVLKRKGFSTSFIRDALGHSTESTTQNYLASFEENVMIDAANSLTSFNSDKK